MSVSRIDILNKTFSRSVSGYNRREVEGFLQEVADTVGRLAEEKKTLQARQDELEALLDEHREREKTLRDTLVTTQKMTDELKSTAQREAQLIIDAAHKKAEDLISQGHARLAQIHEDIAELKRTRAQFDMQLRSLVQSHLKMLDMAKEEEMEADASESKVKFLKNASR
jgi:cell division initiation protein